MAWNFQFLDTFAHYTLSQATSKGKWTAGSFTLSGGPSDDAFQTANYGNVTSKVFSGYALQSDKPTGRIVAVRGSIVFTNGTYGDVCGISDSVTGNHIALQVHDQLGFLRVVGPGYVSPVDSSLPISQGELHNFQIAVWWNSGTGKAEFEVHVDAIPIATLTVTAGPTVAATPGWDMITTDPSSSAPMFRNVHWFWTSQYTNSGGKFGSGDFLPNVKRGVQFPNADSALYPAGHTGGTAHWTPSTGSDYFSRINETLASEAQYIKTTFDPNSAPTGLDRAAYEMANVSSTITSIVAVQRSTLIHAEVGTGTVKLFTRAKGDTNPANTTLDGVITPLSSPTIVTKAELKDPRDNTDWSRTKLNTLERGIETQNLT